MGLLCLTGLSAWAHLANAIEATGVVRAIDHDTRCLVFKWAKTRKPFVPDWKKETEFIKHGRPARPTELKAGEVVRIHYRDVSFHNPLLQNVVWPERQQKQ